MQLPDVLPAASTEVLWISSCVPVGLRSRTVFFPGLSYGNDRWGQIVAPNLRVRYKSLLHLLRTLVVVSKIRCWLEPFYFISSCFLERIRTRARILAAEVRNRCADCRRRTSVTCKNAISHYVLAHVVRLKSCTCVGKSMTGLMIHFHVYVTYTGLVSKIGKPSHSADLNATNVIR